MELNIDAETIRLAYAFQNREDDTSAEKGWYRILRDLVADVVSRGHRIETAFLGKHGGLEVRLVNSVAQELRDAIEQAHIRSLRTCEVCGTVGVQRKLDSGNKSVTCWAHRAWK